MKNNATETNSKLYSLIGEATDTHRPIVIAGRRCSGVLISEENWKAMSETLHLLSIPRMRESIKDGVNIPASECSDELDW